MQNGKKQRRKGSGLLTWRNGSQFSAKYFYTQSQASTAQVKCMSVVESGLFICSLRFSIIHENQLKDRPRKSLRNIFLRGSIYLSKERKPGARIRRDDQGHAAQLATVMRPRTGHGRLSSINVVLEPKVRKETRFNEVHTKLSSMANRGI